MPKITDYRVVLHTNLKDLSEAIRQHIKTGWQPLGGVAFSTAGWAQAIIKSGDEPFRGSA
jgi:hypothetical protein